MSVWWADSGEVRLGEARRLAGWALRRGRLVELIPRQGRLVEEVLLAFFMSNSSKGTWEAGRVAQVVTQGQESRQLGFWQA